jgi:hypothetical protein
MLNWIFKKWDEGKGQAWSGLTWLKIGTSGQALVKAVMNFQFHKMQGISQLARNLSA